MTLFIYLGIVLTKWNGLKLREDSYYFILDLQNQPRIFTNGSDLHIRSGDHDGDIVFEPSQQGKVRLGSYELVRPATLWFWRILVKQEIL